MHKVPTNEHLRRIHQTHQEAPLHNMATKGNNVDRSHITTQSRINPRSLTQPVIGSVSRPVESTSALPYTTQIDPSSPLAGRLSHCVQNWQPITSNLRVLQVVQEYQIEWTRIPLQVDAAITLVTSKEAFLLREVEVENLLLKQAVVVVPLCKDQFIVHLFGRETKDGSYQPVVNLKPLNTFIWKEHFKTEGANVIKDFCNKGTGCAPWTSRMHI